MPKRINTTIDGVTILLNRFIGDERGWLGELLPNGNANLDVKDGLGNIYLSVATGKYITRAGHYHHRQSELFFTVSGVALWAFRDYRELSPTFGKVYSVVFTDSEIDTNFPLYRIGADAMPGIVVPHGVYHVYWALADAPVRVVCMATTPHDDTDYVRLLPEEVSGINEIAKKICPAS